ncbi:MAG: hypothetical protein MJZ74_04620 [Muribaculaceae bacterium]|nr:hypothetical protein [Muribaculaceae bacterium]
MILLNDIQKCTGLAAVLFGLVFSMTSCFTGVENTPKITEKDVSRTIDALERRQPTMTLKPFVDSVPNWETSKRFFVTDDQVKLFLNYDQSLDSVKLSGKYLTYNGYTTQLGIDNRDVVVLNFMESGNKYSYNTGKTMNEFSSKYGLPLLVDMDMVNHYGTQLIGKDVYIKTAVWYDMTSGYKVQGRHFIKVHIDSLLPGNKVMPLKVAFTASDDGQNAFVWMTTTRETVNNRDYDSLFSSKDIHSNYPDITPEHWNLIVHGQVALNMTKEECRLSLGAPKMISRQPNQAEVREYWYYDGGSYLQFVDGLLNAFR